MKSSVKIFHGREFLLLIVVFFVTAFLFISLGAWATTIGTNIDATGTMGAATSTPWGTLTAEQRAAQGRLDPTFVVGDNASSSPFIFVSSKGVVSFGSSTPSAIFLNPGDVVLGRSTATNDLYVSGGLGVNNATTGDGHFVLGNYLIAAYSNNNIGMFGTTSPIIRDGLSLGGVTGTTADLYVSGGLGVNNATTADGDFVLGNYLIAAYKGSNNISMFGTSTASIKEGLTLGGAAGTLSDLYVSGGLGVNNATTADGDFILGNYFIAAYKASNVIGMFGTSTPILREGLSLGGAAGTTADLYVSGGLGVFNATSSDGDFVVGNDFSVTRNGRTILGAATTSKSKVTVDGGNVSISSGGTGTTTLSILTEAAADGANGCIEMSNDGVTYTIMINGAGTGVLVSAGDCDS